MVRAKYVFVDGDRLYAAYESGTKIQLLHPVVDRLGALIGVRAGAVRVALRPGVRPDTPVVWMRVLPMFSTDAAQKLFSELTQPELAIAIARVDVKFEGCSCGVTTFMIGDAIFLPEFEPEDVELFDLRFYAALQELDVWPLVDQQPEPPYEPLTDAIDRLLASLGAHATNLYVEPRVSRQCTHTS